MPCGWGVKAGMVRVWVAGKTVWSPCYTWAIPGCFRDKGLIIKRYINSVVYVRMSTTHLHCILVVLHIDESKSAWPARLVVIDNLHLIDGTVAFKDFSQVTLLGVQTQSKYSKAPARLRILLEENTMTLARHCTRKQQIHDADTTITYTFIVYYALTRCCLRAKLPNHPLILSDMHLFITFHKIRNSLSLPNPLWIHRRFQVSR